MLTRNAAATVRRALESLPRGAEIIVVDANSADATREIAGAFGARIFTEERRPADELPDFAHLRNLALRAASRPWILALDSDEYLSPPLRDAIEGIVKSEPPAAYLVPRKYVDRDGTVIERASTYPNERVYFFHRDAAEAWIKPVHERIRLKAGTTIRRLQHPSLAPLPTIAEFKEKNLRYLAVEAAASRGKGWRYWFHQRVLHTLRSRLIATLRLLAIWLIPRPGKRLPLRHEFLRFWYAWRLIVATCPSVSWFVSACPERSRRAHHDTSLSSRAETRDDRRLRSIR